MRRAAPPPPGPPPSLHCGSPPPTGSYCGLRLRARPREARATGRLRLGGLALGRSRQRSATARCGVAGSRKSWKEGGGRGAAEPRSRAGRGGSRATCGEAKLSPGNAGAAVARGRSPKRRPFNTATPLLGVARPGRPPASSHGPREPRPGSSPPASPPRPEGPPACGSC